MKTIKTERQLEKAVEELEKAQNEIKLFDRLTASGEIDSTEFVEVAARQALVKTADEISKEIFTYRSQNVIGK